MANTAKTAIVTGASRGIGAGLVEAFLKRGYNVVANCALQFRNSSLNVFKRRGPRCRCYLTTTSGGWSIFMAAYRIATWAPSAVTSRGLWTLTKSCCLGAASLIYGVN